jgi:hypothetical protein
VDTDIDNHVVGVFLRCNLFREVDHEQVHAALTDFWVSENHRVTPADPATDDAFVLHEQRNGWTALEWTRGWEWDLRRRAQFHVSRVHNCPGLLIFVYDGDFWGLELFHHGEAMDHFVSWPDWEFFPGRPVGGRPDLLVAQFPDLALDLEHARGYLSVHRYYTSSDVDDEDDARVREGDRWPPGDAMVVFDFLRFLGAPPNSGPLDVLFAAPVWRRFTVAPR